MNNDITSNYEYVSAKKQPAKKVAAPCHAKKDEAPAEVNSGDIKDSMTLLGNMGYAKVKMDSVLKGNTARAIDEFLKNPDIAETYTEFCDGLIADGYSLEDAVITTDNIFKALSSNIYDN